jgi:hypothetical protein
MEAASAVPATYLSGWCYFQYRAALVHSSKKQKRQKEAQEAFIIIDSWLSVLQMLYCPELTIIVDD